MWIESQAQTDGDRSEALRRALVGGAQDDHQEHEGEHYLISAQAPTGELAGRVNAITIRGESACQVEARLTARDQVEYHGGEIPPMTWAPM